MAEGTRMKTIEENLKRLEAIVQWQLAINEKWVNSTQQSLNTTHQFLEESPAANTDSHPVKTGVNSVQENVSVNVNRRPNLVREAPGSSSMEWNQESSDRSSAGGPELRGDVRAQGILTQNQDLATRMANWQQNNEQRFESLTSIVRNISRDREQELQGNSRRPQLNAKSSARNTAPEGANLGSSSAEVNRGTSERSFHSGSLDFEFMVINQPWVNAQEVFVKMSKKECADFELPSTVEDVFGSIDSIRSFVFDPGIACTVVVASVKANSGASSASVDASVPLSFAEYCAHI